MNEPTCAKHPDVVARFTCGRCGNFACRDCERRAAVSSEPVCPACWALTSQAASQTTGNGLQIAGLVVGVISIVPCCPLTLVSLVVNIIALINAKEPPARQARWMPIVGISITLLMVVLQILFFVFYSMFSKPKGL